MQQMLSILPVPQTIPCSVKLMSSDRPPMMLAKAIDEDTCYRCFLADDWNGELVMHA